jgi:thiol-disulfide isomerase/thioredoxin
VLPVKRPLFSLHSAATMVMLAQLLALISCSSDKVEADKVEVDKVEVDKAEVDKAEVEKVEVDKAEVEKASPLAVEVLKLASPKRPKSTKGPQKKRWLGLSVANMTEPVIGAPEDARTQIQRAARGSPSYQAGLRRGDVITAAAGQPVKRFQDYLEQARNIEIGEELLLQISRDGRSFPVRLKMEAKPKNLNLWKRQSFPNTEAFPFELTSLRPGGMKHSQAKDKLQLLYFWATWCGPCRQVAPSIDKLHKKAGETLEIVAISSEEEAVIRRYLRASSTSYPIAHDADGWLKQDYEIRKLPTAVLIGKDGRILAWDYGLGGVHKVLNRAQRELQL